MSIDIGIAHAGYDPARKAGLGRLLKQLESQPPPSMLFSSEHREHASVWVRRLWEWAAKINGPVVLLNDDVTVCPDFLDVVEAMTRAVPDQVIALHTTAPAAASLAAAGERWLRSYWLTGPGYILPKGAAKRLLAWVDRAPRQFIASINEDNVIMHWAWSEQRPIWHCLPALVQHDVDVPSTLGYDSHPMRQTPVAWYAPECAGLDLRSGWEPWGEPVQVECPWMPTGQLARTERSYWEVPELCCLCHVRQGVLTAGSGARVCPQCVVNCVGALGQIASGALR